VETGVRDEPHPSRLASDDPWWSSITTAHRAARLSGESGYLDPETGLWVFTAVHLAERPCCDNGCRHCPYVWAAEGGVPQ